MLPLQHDIVAKYHASAARDPDPSAYKMETAMRETTQLSNTFWERFSKYGPLGTLGI